VRRYGFLTKTDTYEALNRLRDAFLAAKDGNEVNEIINGILTEDEKIKIGRRIQIAESISGEYKYREISKLSSVGYTTILWVSKQVVNYPICFKLLLKRRNKIEKDYHAKKYREVSLSPLPNRRREYSGIKRSDIKR
jgi:uncharacterized protein YerC